MHVRTATQSDLPALRAIVLSGLPSDPVWKYCFPLGRGGAAKLVEDALALWLDGRSPDGSQWLVTVSDDPETGNPVALAVWSLPQATADGDAGKGGDLVAFRNILKERAGSANRLPADATAPAAAAPAPPAPAQHGRQEASSAARLDALAEAAQRATRARDGPLVARFGPQMVLLLTATLPTHRFRGHARRLAAHGVALASRYQAPGTGGGTGGVAVSALAGPMAYIFFSGMRFSDCGLVTVKAPGEKEELDLKVMVQAMPPARRSISQQLLGVFGAGSNSGSSSSATSGGGSPGGRRGSWFEERKRSFEARKASLA